MTRRVEQDLGPARCSHQIALRSVGDQPADEVAEIAAAGARAQPFRNPSERCAVTGERRTRRRTDDLARAVDMLGGRGERYMSRLGHESMRETGNAVFRHDRDRRIDDPGLLLPRPILTLAPRAFVRCVPLRNHRRCPPSLVSS